MKVPENDVTIHRNDAGGVELLVDGHDIAPNVSSWRVDDQGADAPLLTVTIPCVRLRMDVGEAPFPGTTTAPPVRQDPPSVTAARRHALVSADKEQSPWPAR